AVPTLPRPCTPRAPPRPPPPAVSCTGAWDPGSAPHGTPAGSRAPCRALACSRCPPHPQRRHPRRLTRPHPPGPAPPAQPLPVRAAAAVPALTPARIAQDPLLPRRHGPPRRGVRSEEHTSELQSRENLVCRLL